MCVCIDTYARPGGELLDIQWKNICYKVLVADEVVREVDEVGNVIEIKH